MSLISSQNEVLVGPLPVDGSRERVGSRHLNRVGNATLVLAVVIVSSYPAAFKVVRDLDASIVDACNVLCASNVLGLVTLCPFYFRDCAWANLRKVRKREWAALLVGTILYQVIGPFFLLQALITVSVPTVAVLQRLQSVIFFVLASGAMQTRPDCWDIVNVAITMLGIMVALASPPLFGEELALNLGSLYVVISSIALASSLVVTKAFLSNVQIGMLLMFRIGLGTVLYHVYVMLSGGTTGMKKLMLWELWKYMLPMGLVYVTLFQVCWLTALRYASPVVITTGTTAQFVLTLLWTASIQQQLPTRPQLLGAAVLVVSILSSIAKEVRCRSGVAQEREESESRTYLTPPVHDASNDGVMVD